MRSVLYDGPLSCGLWCGATESQLLHWSGHSVHIGHPHCLVFYDAASTHGCHSGHQYCCHPQWVLGHFVNLLWQLVPPQASSHFCEARRQCHLLDHLQLFCGWWGFWLGDLHLQLIRPLLLSHPLPWPLTMMSSFRASQWGESAQWQLLAWRGVMPPSPQETNLGVSPF